MEVSPDARDIMCVYTGVLRVAFCAFTLLYHTCHVGQFLRLENKYINARNRRRHPHRRKVRTNVVQKTYYCTHYVSYNTCIYCAERVQDLTRIDYGEDEDEWGARPHRRV